MKTKAQIVQELLNSDKITAEDAVVLLTEEKEYVHIPTQPNPFYPWSTGPTWVARTSINGDSLTASTYTIK